MERHRPHVAGQAVRSLRRAHDRMAAYKYPRLLEILEELPKTASGKFLRRELRDA